jgi:hypothetical protein
MVVNCNVLVIGERIVRTSCDSANHMAMIRVLSSDGENLWPGCGIIWSLISIPVKLRNILYSEFLEEFKVHSFKILYNCISFLCGTFPGNSPLVCSTYILQFLTSHVFVPKANCRLLSE